MPDSSVYSESREDEGEKQDPDTRCGIGYFKPDFLQVFARIGAFIGIYSSSGLLTSTLVVYVNSQVSMLEKQFGFSSAQTGLLMACNDIGYLSLAIFAGYVAKKVHIPRGLSVSTMLYGVCGIMCALPYFIQDKSVYVITEGSTMGNSSTAGPFRPSALPICSRDAISGINSKCDSGLSSSYDREQLWIKKLAFVLIAVGMVFQGIGKCPRYPFVTLYIDNAVDKRKTGFYMGIITGTGIFGPALAYVVGGLFSKIYVTLEDVPISPKDPRWIGAWWLGFLIFGACALLTSIPIMCFPARIKKKNQNRQVQELKKEPSKQKGHENVVKAEAKQFAFSLGRVLRNPVYLLIMVATCLNLLSVGGTNSFMPKYLASQYSVPLWQTNIILAVSNIMAVSLGSFLGGIMTRRIKMTPKTTMKMLFVFYLLNIILFGTSFLLGCEQPDLMGGVIDRNASSTLQNSLSPAPGPVLYRQLESNCTAGCDCSDDIYFPVCGEDGRSFFSPCHAGCQQARGISFTNCTCIEGGKAIGGLCDQGCEGKLYAFAAITFVSSLIAAFKIVPTLIIKLRCVESRDRSVSVAISGFSSSALGWMPGPVIFGNIIDGTCLLWRYTCGERQSCYLYDTALFRGAVVAYGISLKCAAMLIILVALWKVRNLEDWPNQEGAVGAKPKREQTENIENGTSVNAS